MKLKFDFAVSVKEIGDHLLSVTYASGRHATYDGIGVTKNWLTMDDDSFYELYGFNFIPSIRLKEKARMELM